MPRVIVCGGREYASREQVERTLRLLDPHATTVVHGGARGADSIAGEVARMLRMRVQVVPADWDLHGRAAGPIRNQQMLDLGVDLVIAFPGGTGTADMMRRAREAGVPVLAIPAS